MRLSLFAMMTTSALTAASLRLVGRHGQTDHSVWPSAQTMAQNASFPASLPYSPIFTYPLQGYWPLYRYIQWL